MEKAIELLQSDNWEDRFKGEYYLLTDKIAKLASMLTKYREGTLDFQPNCPYGLLNDQLLNMMKYKENLEERSKIENIEL